MWVVHRNSASNRSQSSPHDETTLEASGCFSSLLSHPSSLLLSATEEGGVVRGIAAWHQPSENQHENKSWGLDFLWSKYNAECCWECESDCKQEWSQRSCIRFSTQKENQRMSMRIDLGLTERESENGLRDRESENEFVLSSFDLIITTSTSDKECVWVCDCENGLREREAGQTSGNAATAAVRAASQASLALPVWSQQSQHNVPCGSSACRTNQINRNARNTNQENFC